MRVEPSAQPPSEHEPSSRERRAVPWWGVARLLIGLGGGLAVLTEYNAARSDADAASAADASAIQIVQVWTPHIYYVIVIVAAMIALYIITRYAD